MILWKAALEHHVTAPLLGEAGTAKLLGDLGVTGFSTGHYSEIEHELYQVLAAFRRRSQEKMPPHLEQLASILEEANILDEAFETESWSLGELETDPWVSKILDKLRVLNGDAVYYVNQHLPELSSFAKEALKTLSEDRSPDELAGITQAHPEVAEYIVRAANSTSPQPIERIDQAVTYLGLEAARTIALAASLRPLFDFPPFHALWNHSLDSAQICEKLAAISGCWQASEAFLAGLIHDIGRLVMIQLPPEFQDRYFRLVQQGCPILETETALAGFTHADCGASILEAWKFPAAIVEPVRNHHRLADPSSKLAALLYLAEFWCAEEEDLPSSVRLHAALSACGIGESKLLGRDIHLESPVQVLRFNS
jgi:HD-like signal output (HDOD) protein